MARQADALVERIKGVVPVDTGELRNSIGWTWGRVAKGKTILAQATSQLGGELTITVFAGDASTITKGKKKTFWQIARIVEFGSQGRAAQPYFFPVWRAYKKDIKAAIRAAGKEAIKKAAGK